jgi:TolA-binding protein
VTAACIATVALVALALGWRSTRALSYAVDGGHVEQSGFIAAEPAGQPRLRFSDGTEVLLTSGTKASLRSVDGHGARVSLADGSVQVDVTHVPRARWLFDAGPFLIAVTGTAFNVEWKPADEQLDVHMQRGTVEVSGPLSTEATVLRAGQHLTIRVRRRETIIRSLDDDEISSTAPPPVPVQNAAPPIQPPPVADAPVDPDLWRAASARATAQSKVSPDSPTRTAGAGNQSWADELSRGSFETIIGQAKRLGLEACLADANSNDLAALADAARYGRHDDIARRALLAQRRRFPLSPSARDASFLLGRLEEAEQKPTDAIDWYDRYLAESATGTYASEALGRKMNITERLYGAERARRIAMDYVDRFPQGTYAGRARALARAP